MLNTCSLGQEEKYLELSSRTFGIFSSENTELQRGGLDHKVLKAPIINLMLFESSWLLGGMGTKPHLLPSLSRTVCEEDVHTSQH